MKISSIVNHIRSTMQVEVEGYFVERFINLCVLNKINIWNIKNITSGSISFFTIPGELKKMEPFLSRTKCKLKIVKKSGIYFGILKYKKRRAALVAAVLILIGVYISSTFVWDINVYGNEKVPTDVIIEKLKAMDIYKGRNKYSISENKISDYIRSQFYEVAWVGAKMDGTTLSIQIVEKVISDEKEKNEIVGDIVATKDAVITKIVAENGTALYKLDSFIKKGSVAIEGKLYANGILEKQVHATGYLRGKVEYNYSREYPFNEVKKTYTGKTRYGVGFGINNKKIIAKYLPKEYKYDISSDEKVLNIFGINFKYIFNRYAEYTQEEKTNTKDELINKAKVDAAKFLATLEADGKTYISHNVEVKEYDEKIVYSVVYEIEEDIGEFVELGE